MPTNDKVNYEVFKVDGNGVCTADGGFVGDLEAVILDVTGQANANNVVISGFLEVGNLPTSDPVLAGTFWNDGGTVKVSAGI